MSGAPKLQWPGSIKQIYQEKGLKGTGAGLQHGQSRKNNKREDSAKPGKERACGRRGSIKKVGRKRRV